MQEIIANEPQFKLDYLSIIDENNFSIANERTVNARILIAGWVEGVRLIDNMPVQNWTCLEK
jgi:pantoate--beta-alanine ligase